MELIRKIQKKDEIKLLKCPSVKKQIKENSIYLERYKIVLPIKKDEDFFYFEALIQTLKNKEIFEGSFVKSYDDMYDYWQTLTYEEKKRLINADLYPIIKKLPYVLVNDQKMYLPCMNDKLNLIYKNEMVLFELKQYNRLRFDCKEMIDKNEINLSMIQYHFTSLEYICGDDLNYWCYCSINHTLYHFVNACIIDKFTIVKFEGKVEELKEFVYDYMNQNEEACLDFLINHDLIQDKLKNKLIKIRERRKK